MDRYQILEDLKAWLAAEHKKLTGRFPGQDWVRTPYSEVLGKIDALELEHE